VIELRKRTVLKIVVGSVFICSFILALMYPVIFASYKGKIHFLMSPNPHALFSPPSGKEADIVIVLIAVMKDSTYGSFTMAFVGYENYHVAPEHYESHWYTDRLEAGKTYAYLTARTSPGVEWEYDVSVAKIDVASSEHQLNATVIVKGKVLFSVGYWANTSASIASRIEPTTLSPELYLSVEAYRPTLKAFVTGIEVGDFQGGRFDYIDTELIDSSLLP